MSLTVNVPINPVSFGQISTLFLRELHKRNQNVNIFPIGNNIDLSTQSNIDQSFVDWIQSSINKSYSKHNRNDPSFKLWHLNGSLESYSNKQVLLSFYELDSPTKEEVNVVKNNHKVLFSSEYTVNIFKSLGCDNVYYCPLAFDKYNFSKTNKAYSNGERITFNLVGKLEKRKNHKKVLSAWIKKYGNDKRYTLQCSIYNTFLKPEDQSALIAQVLDNKNYFNIQFLGFMGQNALYNDYLNSADIVIGMSGGEGWGLPEFQSVALGKYAIVLDVNGYKSWANKENSILINPSEKIEAYDNMFFRKDQPFNQGNIFTFDEDEFIAGCEKAIEQVRINSVNANGLKLQDQFSSQNMADQILNHLK